MDPYLEDPGWWPTVHHWVIGDICRELNSSLPADYVANIEERNYIDFFDDTFFPDAGIHRVSEESPHYGAANDSSILPDGSVIVAAQEEEIRERFLQIIHAQGQERVIAQIELLSPSNKDPRRRGRELYLEKQRQILQSGTHLVEIDLLRNGKHTVACPERLLHGRGSWNYLVCLHRANDAAIFQVWLSTVRMPLPIVRIPLEKHDDEVLLDLQALLGRCYDACAFRKRIKYGTPSNPPLSPEDDAWANDLLKQRNLR